MRGWLLAVFLVFGRAAFGQLDSDSITISASRSIDSQPDQVVFNVTVQSGPSASFDDTLNAVQGLGITAADLVGVNLPVTLIPNPAFQAMTGWVFSLTAPLDRIQATIVSITALQQTIAQKNNGLSLSFAVRGTQVSSALQQQDQCPTADLVSDAQQQARKLADAAGLTVGPIVALSDGPDASTAYFASPTIALWFNTASPYLASPPTFPCLITVKFQLLRYQ